MAEMLLNGRRVVDVEVDGVDRRDYPDFCDAYFTSAVFEDTLEDLNEDQLDELRDLYPEVIYEVALDRAF